jgi:DNA-binding NtrC family response regulator
MASILIVDDEPNIRNVLSLLLGEHGHTPTAVASGEAALLATDKTAFDLVLLDMTLPGMNGMDVLRALIDRGSAPPTIILTAFGSIRSAVEAIKAGAFDYLPKPFDNDELLLTIDRVLEHCRLRVEVQSLRTELDMRYESLDMVGASAPMREVFRMMSRLAGLDTIVLILGESGTGKELVARGIHRHSARSKGPFVAVNCSAIPSTLVESTFFGHEKGAFTDANETSIGKFEQAHRGTLFLDEIGDLALDAQAKLLRALEERQVTRVGGRQPIPTDVRVLAATNRNLDQAVAKGEFRKDLFYRLNVVQLHLPPLRDRADDLPALIDHILRRLSIELRMPNAAIAPDARRMLLAHHWPGNVRELENTLMGSLVVGQDQTLRSRDLPPGVRDGATAGEATESPSLLELVDRAVERIERSLIQEALNETRGNRSLTAQSLGINRKTLFNKMNTYGLATGNDDDAE